MSYDLDTYPITKAGDQFQVSVDYLLGLAEKKSIFLYVYIANYQDYYVLWDGESTHDRIKNKYILVDRYAEALRTHGKKNIKYVLKQEDGEIISGKLFIEDHIQGYVKTGPTITRDQVIITKETLDKVLSGENTEAGSGL